MKLSIIKKILLLITFIAIVNSCEESSNPVSPISSEHSKILFLAQNRLCIINADGSDFQLIPTVGSYSFKANLSTDASKIVYGSVDTTFQQLFLYNMNTKETSSVTDDSLFHDSPVFSPDGQSVLFITRIGWMHHLHLKNINNGEVEHLNDEFNSYSPAFSYDGTKIACRINNGGDSVGVVIMNRDGSNPQLLGQGNYPTFSPDGKKILFQKFMPPNDNGLYIMDVDGTNEKFLSKIGFQSKPMFSPDGSRIVFSMYVSNYDIYLINVDGTNLINLTNSENGETQPKFIEDGSKLVFIEYDKTSRIENLCTMNIDGTEKQIIYKDSTIYGMRIF